MRVSFPVSFKLKPKSAVRLKVRGKKYKPKKAIKIMSKKEQI